MEHLTKRMEELIQRTRNKGIRKKLATILAGIVVFTTVYQTILPAITINVETAEEMAGMDLVIDEAELETQSAAEEISKTSHSDASDGSAFDGLTIQTMEEVSDYNAESYLGKEETWEYKTNGAIEPEPKTADEEVLEEQESETDIEKTISKDKPESETE